MRLHYFFLLTHGAAAVAVAMMTAVAVQSGTVESFVLSSALSLVTLGAAAWYASVRVCGGLANLETVVADQDACETLNSGLFEIDQSADRIAVDAARWESVAANNREQARDFQSMMFLLNRRGPDRPATSGQLRGLLAGLGNTLYSRLKEIENSSTDIERNTQLIVDGCESQSETIIVTTAHLGQLCSAIEIVLANAIDVDSANQSSTKLAVATRESVRKIGAALKQMRVDSQSCEKKLRGLCDPVQQINGIVETISDLAGRTDLLALNASIEAVRAGENGRQFAKVADEVRKLAEQSTDATREITSLLDSMQLVTQESIHQITRGRESVESHVTTAADAESSLDQICGAVNDGASRVRQIRESSSQQLQLAQGIVNALESISEIAKASRGDAETCLWLSKSITKTPADFATAVKRLRQCDGAVFQDEPSDNHTKPTAEVVPAAPIAASTMSSTLATTE